MGGRGVKRWSLHLCLLLVIALEAGVFALRHRDVDELRAAAAAGSAHRRIAALHVLTNRDEPSANVDPRALEELIVDEDPLLREFACTIAPCRLGAAKALEESRFVFQVPIDDEELREWWRRYAIYRRKVGDAEVGAHRRLVRREVEWFYAARAGEPLDRELLLRHIATRVPFGRPDGASDSW